MNSIAELLPPMLIGEGLWKEFTVLPAYKEDILNSDAVTRLVALSDLYNVYVPSTMTAEIYSKLYLAMLHSLNRKVTTDAVMQRNVNYGQIRNGNKNGIIGGSDSFTIIGSSGIGKSSAIMQGIRVATGYKTLEIEEPYTKVIPCVTVQCPFDCSVKGLLFEILRKVDEIIGSRYYEQALRARATTDMLVGSVSQTALNHVGLLIVDEIQNVVNNTRQWARYRGRSRGRFRRNIDPADAQVSTQKKCRIYAVFAALYASKCAPVCGAGDRFRDRFGTWIGAVSVQFTVHGSVQCQCSFRPRFLPRFRTSTAARPCMSPQLSVRGVGENEGERGEV